ncbi:MAG: RsmE family RNA methyltransferase [Vicingaceae bacterium]
MASFYIPDCSLETNALSEEESRHASKSLRLKNLDEIEILNGSGSVFSVRILDLSKKKATIEVYAEKVFNPRDPSLCLAVSPLKFNDRFEFLVEKASEMGVKRIVPILCERTERKIIKKERLMRIAISALKQSGNPFLIEITDPVSLEHFVLQDKSQTKLAATIGNEYSVSLKKVDYKHEVSTIIGPEGGFTSEEASLISRNNYLPVNLGPNVLRAESASIAVSAYFHMQKK